MAEGAEVSLCWAAWLISAVAVAQPCAFSDRRVLKHKVIDDNGIQMELHGPEAEEWMMEAHYLTKSALSFQEEGKKYGGSFFRLFKNHTAAPGNR